MGQMPTANLDGQTVARWEAAIGCLERPATDDEAQALVAVLPQEAGDHLRLCWKLMTFIESAPNWLVAGAALEGDGHWETYLRQRAERGGNSMKQMLRHLAIVNGRKRSAVPIGLLFGVLAIRNVVAIPGAVDGGDSFFIAVLVLSTVLLVVVGAFELVGWRLAKQETRSGSA
jgi:hypothetical protein